MKPLFQFNIPIGEPITIRGASLSFNYPVTVFINGVMEEDKIIKKKDKKNIPAIPEKIIAATKKSMAKKIKETIKKNPPRVRKKYLSELYSIIDQYLTKNELATPIQIYRHILIKKPDQQERQVYNLLATARAAKRYITPQTGVYKLNPDFKP